MIAWTAPPRNVGPVRLYRFRANESRLAVVAHGHADLIVKALLKAGHTPKVVE
jgi:hypothetical protein